MLAFLANNPPSPVSATLHLCAVTRKVREGEMEKGRGNEDEIGDPSAGGRGLRKAIGATELIASLLSHVEQGKGEARGDEGMRCILYLESSSFTPPNSRRNATWASRGSRRAACQMFSPSSFCS